jgi:hypothetical protein
MNNEEIIQKQQEEIQRLNLLIDTLTGQYTNMKLWKESLEDKLIVFTSDRKQ